MKNFNIVYDLDNIIEGYQEYRDKLPDFVFEVNIINILIEMHTFFDIIEETFSEKF